MKAPYKVLRQTHIKIRNLRFKQLNNQSSLIFSPRDDPDPVEQQYKSVLQYLSRATFQKSDIKTLVQSLDDENIFKVYQGILGLYQLAYEENIFSIDGEEEEQDHNVLQTGIMKKLAGLLSWNDHQFIVTRSLQILNLLIPLINDNHFSVYCENIFSWNVLAKAVSSDPSNLTQNFYLMNRIRDGGIKIGCIDENAPFLQEIEQMLNNQKDNIDLVRRAGRLLSNLDLKFTTGHRMFANDVFKIKKICFAIYRQQGRLDLICDAIEQLDEAKKIKWLLSMKTIQVQSIFPDLEAYVMDVLDLLIQLVRKFCSEKKTQRCKNFIRNLVIFAKFQNVGIIQKVNCFVMEIITWQDGAYYRQLQANSLITSFFQNCLKLEQEQQRRFMIQIKKVMSKAQRQKSWYFSLLKGGILSRVNMIIIDKIQSRFLDQQMREVKMFFEKFRQKQVPAPNLEYPQHNQIQPTLFKYFRREQRVRDYMNDTG